MELTGHWLRVGFTGALVFGIVLAPLSAEAQTHGKRASKRHKVVHTKKTHGRVVHHRRRANAVVIPVIHVAPAPAVAVTTPPPVVPTGPVAGTPYDENAWRGFHSDWNGQYSFNEGKYYYDQEHKYPAVIPNDFNSIVGRFGGVATLDNDPTLVFTGDSGDPYPIVQYNVDRVNSDKKLKLKSAFFGRAYFWRDGARYDRKIVIDDKGARCFQFVKHP